MAKIEINWRPYWIYAYYRDGQNKINRRPVIEFMLIVEMAKIEIQPAATLKLCYYWPSL